MARTLILAGLTALAAATVATSSPAHHGQGRIVFSQRSGPDGARSLFTMRTDGSRQRSVSQPGPLQDDSQADWSPDGRRIAFRRFFNGGTERETTDILVADEDGKGLRNISRASCTGECLGSEEPAWSPDGRRIAFMRAFGPFTEAGYPSIVGLFVMHADGSNVRQLTQRRPNSGTEDHFPTWSPDGSRIAFMRWNGSAQPTNASAIYTVDARGADERLLRRMPPEWPGAGAPDWSPDGRRILFSTYCYYPGCGGPETGAQLFTIDPRGRDQRQLTNVVGNAFNASWSPDGRSIVFAHHERTGAPARLVAIRSDGSRLRPLISDPAADTSYPDWSASSRR